MEFSFKMDEIREPEVKRDKSNIILISSILLK